MRANLRDALRAGVPRGRPLLLSVLLTMLVVVAAGLAGTAHLTGARWVPHWSAHRAAPPKVRSSPRSTIPAVTAAPRAGFHLPLAPVLWVVVGLLVAGVAFLAWRWWSRRRTHRGREVRLPATDRAQAVAPEPDPEPETLVTGIELALAVLDEHREPADAVVRAWLGLEETAEESGLVRRPAETPTEFTSRILRKAFADDRAIATLLRLYLRARFGAHPVTESDVAAVREALGELVRTWRPAEAAGAVRSR